MYVYNVIYSAQLPETALVTAAARVAVAAQFILLGCRIWCVARMRCATAARPPPCLATARGALWRAFRAVRAARAGTGVSAPSSCITAVPNSASTVAARATAVYG